MDLAAGDDARNASSRARVERRQAQVLFAIPVNPEGLSARDGRAGCDVASAGSREFEARNALRAQLPVGPKPARPEQNPRY